MERILSDLAHFDIPILPDFKNMSNPDFGGI